MAQSARNQLLIFLPTYNERENVAEIIDSIRSLDIAADILVIDDNSPDGTGQFLAERSQVEAGFFVIHRPGKHGIGSAHREALLYACEHGYSRLITMDADRTHAPEDIPRLLSCAAEAELVIGSRFAAGAVDRRSRGERYWSRLSHWATSRWLKLPYDLTSAYRLYRLDGIDPVLFGRIQSSGYAFFFESAVLLSRTGLRIQEVPLHLSGRGAGKSKTGIADIFSWSKELVLLRGRGVFHHNV